MGCRLPNFGEPVVGRGGRLGAIICGSAVECAKVGYALIFSDLKLPSLPWGDFGHRVFSADSLVDGYANTLAMQKSACMPAQYIRKKFIHLGFSDWYIPSLAECWLLHASVPELMPQNLCWSSTEESSCYSWAFDYSSGEFSWKPKDKCFSSVAVRRIEINLGSMQ